MDGRGAVRFSPERRDDHGELGGDALCGAAATARIQI
jgi:hypothetical protein